MGSSGRVSQRRGLEDENAPTTDGSWGRAVWTGARARAKIWRWNNTEAGAVGRGLRASWVSREGGFFLSVMGSLRSTLVDKDH